MEIDFVLMQTEHRAEHHSQGSNLLLDCFVCQHISPFRNNLRHDDSLPHRFPFSLGFVSKRLFKHPKFYQAFEGADRHLQNT